jgi:hypothetical protein
MERKAAPTHFRVALFDSEEAPYTITADNEDQHEMCERDPRFVKWITDWQPANHAADEPTLASYGLGMETCTLKRADLEYSYELRFIGGIPFVGKNPPHSRHKKKGGDS